MMILDTEKFIFAAQQLPLYRLAASEGDLQAVALEGEVLMLAGADLPSALRDYFNSAEGMLQRWYETGGRSFVLSSAVYRRLGEQLPAYLSYRFPGLDEELIASLQGQWQSGKTGDQSLLDLFKKGLGIEGVMSRDMQAFLLYRSTEKSDQLYLLDISTLCNDSSDQALKRLSSFFIFHSSQLAQMDRNAAIAMEVTLNSLPMKASVKASWSIEGKRSKVLFSVSESSALEADEVFESSQHIVERDIQAHIDRLKRSGFEQLLLKLVVENFGAESLQKLLQTTEVAPSPLKVTAKYQLQLPAFNNKEIKLTPLVKTLYLFFLKHPEGVVFKKLPKYKQELLELYLEVQPTGELAKMKASIEDLANPFGNSINEKCSRIKGELLKMMTPELAKYYYVVAGRGGRKYIPIAREGSGELLSWEKMGA